MHTGKFEKVKEVLHQKKQKYTHGLTKTVTPCILLTDNLESKESMNKKNAYLFNMH
jgi:hypothetical protein